MKSTPKAVILIVDDKPANVLALEHLLQDKDRQVLSASNGKEALQIALNKAVDLIILDVQMPDMDGFEVAHILKSNKRTREIPIIFATAESREPGSVMKGYGEGAIDYLSKPLNPEIVKAKVAVLLQIQLQKKELIEKNNSLQQCALLIDNSADIIGIIDARTFQIDEINSAFTNILGYSKEECKTVPLTFYLSNEDRVMVQALSKNGKERLSFETRIYSKDRNIKWLHWNVVARYGKWFVNARDITEVKEVEKVRTYLATVVKQSNDAIYIHDEGGRIITWNEGAEKIYGYTEQEALRMKIWNLIPEYLQTETGEMIYQVLQGNKVQDRETQRITKHGKLVNVLFSASLITETENQQISIAVTDRDVTRQKIAEDKLRENEAFLKSILNTMGDAVVVADAEGRPALLNPAAEKILGKDHEGINFNEWTTRYGLYYPDRVTPFPLERIPLLQALQGKEITQEEIFIRNAQVPEGMYVTTSSNPLKDDHANVVGGVSVIHDITDQKKAEVRIQQLNDDLLKNVQQLEATNKELESFSYSVSHDLRAPLRGLNGYSKMLEEDYGEVLDNEGKRLLGNIQHNAIKMGVLIDDLLEFSRLGRKDLQKTEMNMNDLVKDALNEINASTSHHATIKVQNLCPAVADASLLRQVWINLISNAIKYSGKKEAPQVEIGSSQCGSEVVYHVKDNGAGFNMKYAEKLFGVFQRLHNRRDFEGTGIGLAIVQRIVAKHGGKVWADAKENEGATFYFSLPLS